MGKLAMVIMAAGIGSRYGGLKQVDPVAPTAKLSLITRFMMPGGQVLNRSFSSSDLISNRFLKKRLALKQKSILKSPMFSRKSRAVYRLASKSLLVGESPGERDRLSCSVSRLFPAIFWSLMPMIFMAMRPLKSWLIT